jgi:hypothetical protein
MGQFDEFMLNGLKTLRFLGSNFFPLKGEIVTAGRQSDELISPWKIRLAYEVESLGRCCF